MARGSHAPLGRPCSTVTYGQDARVRIPDLRGYHICGIREKSDPNLDAIGSSRKFRSLTTLMTLRQFEIFLAIARTIETRRSFPRSPGSAIAICGEK
jgi:hypothetical protein